MSRLAIQVTREEVRATAVLEFGPGQPVQYGADERVLSEVLKLDRPLPLAVLVRHVLTRYGLEPATETNGEEHQADNDFSEIAPSELRA